MNNNVYKGLAILCAIMIAFTVLGGFAAFDIYKNFDHESGIYGILQSVLQPEADELNELSEPTSETEFFVYQTDGLKFNRVEGTEEFVSVTAFERMTFDNTVGAYKLYLNDNEFTTGTEHGAINAVSTLAFRDIHGALTEIKMLVSLYFFADRTQLVISFAGVNNVGLINNMIAADGISVRVLNAISSDETPHYVSSLIDGARAFVSSGTNSGLVKYTIDLTDSAYAYALCKLSTSSFKRVTAADFTGTGLNEIGNNYIDTYVPAGSEYLGLYGLEQSEYRYSPMNALSDVFSEENCVLPAGYVSYLTANSLLSGMRFLPGRTYTFYLPLSDEKLFLTPTTDTGRDTLTTTLYNSNTGAEQALPAFRPCYIVSSLYAVNPSKYMYLPGPLPYYPLFSTKELEDIGGGAHYIKIKSADYVPKTQFTNADLTFTPIYDGTVSFIEFSGYNVLVKEDEAVSSYSADIYIDSTKYNQAFVSNAPAIDLDGFIYSYGAKLDKIRIHLPAGSYTFHYNWNKDIVDGSGKLKDKIEYVKADGVTVWEYCRETNEIRSA